MRLIVNGDEQEAKKATTVADLLSDRGLSSTRVAVEVNERIVPRATHANHELKEGDVVEIVHFVGGG